MIHRVGLGKFMVGRMRQQGGGIQALPEPGYLILGIHIPPLGYQGDIFRALADRGIVGMDIGPNINTDRIRLDITAPQPVGYRQLDTYHAVGGTGPEADAVADIGAGTLRGSDFPIVGSRSVGIGQIEGDRLVGTSSRMQYVLIGNRQYRYHYRVGMFATQGTLTRHDQ